MTLSLMVTVLQALGPLTLWHRQQNWWLVLAINSPLLPPLSALLAAQLLGTSVIATKVVLLLLAKWETKNPRQR